MIELQVMPYDALGKYTLLTSLLLLCIVVPLLLGLLRTLFGFLTGVPKWTLAALLLILIVASYLRIVLYPHLFGLYLDDYYTLEIANKIVHLDFASLNPIFVANGLIFVPFFLLFGVSFKVGMAISILLSLVSLFLFFVLAYLLTKSNAVALIATASMAVQPSHIQYSFSTYNHTPIFFFLLLALGAFFTYFEARKTGLLYLSFFSILFLLEMRIEILLLVPILFAYWAYQEKNKLRVMSIWFPWMVLGAGILILIPKFLFFNLNLLNYSLMSTSNFLSNLGDISELLGLHVIAFTFMVIGVIVAIRKKNHGLLGVSCFAICLLALILSMESSQINGGRHLHFTIGTIYLLFGYGVLFLADLIQNKHLKVALLGIVLLLIVAQGVMHNVSLVEAEKNFTGFNQIYFDTRLPESAADLIPDDCILVTPHPSKYSATTRIRAIPIEYFLPIPKAQLKDTCYVFADDLSCMYPLHEVDGKCDLIREEYELSYLGKIDSSQIPTPNRNLRINATFYYIKP